MKDHLASYKLPKCPTVSVGSLVFPFKKRLEVLGYLLTVFLVTVLVAHDGATPEHHLILRQGPRLIREDILDLAQVLCDVEGSALNGPICFFIAQVKVIM